MNFLLKCLHLHPAKTFQLALPAPPISALASLYKLKYGILLSIVFFFISLFYTCVDEVVAVIVSEGAITIGYDSAWSPVGHAIACHHFDTASSECGNSVKIAVFDALGRLTGILLVQKKWF